MCICNLGVVVWPTYLAGEKLVGYKLTRSYDSSWLKVLDSIGKSFGGNELFELCKGKQNVQHAKALNICSDTESYDSDWSHFVALNEMIEDSMDTGKTNDTLNG